MKSSEEILGPATIIKAFIKNRRVVYAIVAAGLSISLALALLLPKKYTATATILPSGQGGALGKLSNLVMSQSSALTAKIPENSSLLYPTVLSSRYLLLKLVHSDFTIDDKTVRLGEFLGAKADEEALEKVRKTVDVAIDKKTQVIRIRATTKSPVLSAAIVNRMIELLKEFNEEKSTKRAGHTYGYLKKKLKEAQQQLYEAESALMEFEKTHRDYAVSTDPDVLMEHQKLTRNLELKEASYIEILKEIELTKIELKREAPIVKVLDFASPPTIKSAPRRKVIAVIGGMLTVVISFTYCILKEIPIPIILQRFS